MSRRAVIASGDHGGGAQFVAPNAANLPQISPDTCCLGRGGWQGFERTAEDNYEEAVKLKAEGTAAFSSGLWLEAQVHYHKATRLLLDEYEELIRPIGKQPNEVRDLMVACELNIAQCALKREEWFMADKVCTEVLQRLVDPMGTDREQNLKALFRTRAPSCRARGRSRTQRVD